MGDALGLPAEGLSSDRAQRLWNGQWRMRFLFGRGMFSDDTEHTVMVAQALLAHPDDLAAFQRCLAWKLRWWFVGLPAGAGLATARACIKLWLGFSPETSGVFSAGNGPAMRSAILGVFFCNDPDQREAFVAAATHLTHTDPKAKIAAQAVAKAAACAALCGNEATAVERTKLIESLRQEGDCTQWSTLLDKILVASERQLSVVDFAHSIDLQKGVTGFAYHTVPVALYAWIRHPNDFEAAVTSVLNCGGDTDTTGAIIGALMGAQLGTESIPKLWLNRCADWPRSIGYLEQVAARLAVSSEGNPEKEIPLFWPGVLIRNLLFLLVVLLHGFRRLFPPY